jgi:hypothetical protein
MASAKRASKRIPTKAPTGIAGFDEIKLTPPPLPRIVGTPSDTRSVLDLSGVEAAAA